MERKQIMTILLNRADDVRRLALDALDDRARQTNSWGSQGHRSARDGVEREYDQQALRFERLDDEALNSELASQPSA